MKYTFLLFIVFIFTPLTYAKNAPQIRLDAGISLHQIRNHEFLEQDIAPFGSNEFGQYIGIAFHKQIKPAHHIGVKIDQQNLGGYRFNSVRAIDYMYQVNDDIKVNGFIGAARYMFRTPAYGYTLGFGGYYRPHNWGQWGVSLEAQYHDKLARDKLHPDDPNVNSDSFIDIRAIAVGVNYFF